MKLEDIVKEQKSVGDISVERKICINAIMSTEFIKGIKPLLNDLTLFDSPMCRTILSWAVTYFNKYGIAMKETVTDIYSNQKSKISKTNSQDISDFLESISNQYASEDMTLHNYKFELDIANEYIEVKNIIKLKQKIDKAMLTNNITKAKQEINNYNQKVIKPTSSVNALKDFSRFEDALKKDNVLFQLPYPFNELYGDICRRHLSAVAAQSKVGKSRELAWFACQALRAGEAVFIGTLEMEISEFLALIDFEMLRADLYGGMGKIPVFSGTGTETIIKHMPYMREAQTKEELEKKWEALGLFNPRGSLHIQAWPQFSCAVEEDLVPELDRIREEEGITITTIVLDYADLLKENRGDEREPTRLKVAGKWRALKKLAQKRELHLHTASQLGKEGQLFESSTKQQDANFIIKLEQTPIEKRLGIYRQSVMFHRGIAYDPSRPLITLANNGIGLFNLDAKWSHEDWDYLPDIDEDICLWKVFTGEEWYEEIGYDYDYDNELEYNLHRSYK